MIRFVNAKINIGLQIVSRRPDGYHDLQTLFYPVGVYAGTAENPLPFCDIVEVTPFEGPARFRLNCEGRRVDCPEEKNLVWRAAELFFEEYAPEGFNAAITLFKNLPDGAGMGGGSADAAFTLLTLADVADEYSRSRALDRRRPSDDELARLALRLGADCPFFIFNRPAYATGVGERLEPVELDLGGYWLLAVKPKVSISTREAFAGVVPAPASVDLRTVARCRPAEWRGVVVNDFERSIFPAHPEMAAVKERLYSCGADYASLTGSGSCIYGIFPDYASALSAQNEIEVLPTIEATYLLKL